MNIFLIWDHQIGSLDDEFSLNKKKYDIPQFLNWQGVAWALRAAIIYVPGDYLGHYVSIVRVEGNWIKYDDDDVTALNERHALSSLKNNTYGCVYGVIYDRQ